MKINLSHPQGFKPLDFQVEGIKKAYLWRRLILGDDMGLGKTMQSIATVEAIGEGKTLVICPASLKINWKTEIEMWTNKKALILNNKHVHTWHYYLDASQMGGMFAGQFDYFIVNYDSLKKFFVYKYLSTKPSLSEIVFSPSISLFNTIIVDEAHTVNNPKSQRSKLVMGLAHGKRNRMLLTGTPIVNDVKDLIAPLAILGRLQDFGGARKFEYDYGEGENLEDLQDKFKQFYFRREKKDVLKDMPEKFRTIMKIDIDTKKEYNLAVDDLAQYFREHTHKNEFQINRSMRGKGMVLIATLKRISALGKIFAIREYLKNVKSANKKMILFMDRLELVDEFKRLYPEAVTITGPDSYQKRAQSEKKFMEDPGCWLIICSIKAAGIGLNLQSADFVGFVEYWWTFAAMLQAEDRAYRKGRKDHVHCVWWEGHQTIDYYIRSVIFGKKDVSERVTGAVEYTKDKSQDQLLKELFANIDKLKLT